MFDAVPNHLIGGAMYQNKPCAAAGLLSYRYRGAYGWIMIGAKDDADALREAGRSLSHGEPVMAKLEKWNGAEYAPLIGRVFYERFGIGRTRYSVHFHDGVQTHKDGSPFFGIALFGNKIETRRYVAKLEREGYVRA